MSDRRETVRQFRERLRQVIRDTGLSQSAFASAAGVERSTLSQLLSTANDRLPRIETALAIAGTGQASLDWLFGLSHEGPAGTAILPQPLEVAPWAPSPVDERLVGWHAEALGYKVRYVPTTLPDLLKGEPLIEYELREFPVTTTERASTSASDSSNAWSSWWTSSTRPSVGSSMTGSSVTRCR